jgi:multidrug efflux pump subunit AcrA (membrane-fusion protein)
MLLGAGEKGAEEVPGTTLKATAEVATSKSVDVVTESVGSVRARQSASLQSQVMGRVVKVLVREGDRVESGQALVEVDPRTAGSQVDSARSSVTEAEAALAEAEQALNAARETRKAADAQKTLADATFKRFQELSSKDAVSRQLFDEAQAKQKAAEADAARAGDMLQSAEARRDQAQARVEQARSGLDNAQTAMSYTQVVAPFAGIVSSRKVDSGDMAGPGVVLLVVDSTEGYRLEAHVSESDVVNLKVGTKASCLFDSSNETIDAEVTEIVPETNTRSRDVTIKIDLPNRDYFKTGLFGRAQFVTGQQTTMTVPRTAIFERGQLASVFVVDENSVARLRLVKTGRLYGERLEILSGVAEGERVLVEAKGASDGVRVQIVQP